MNIKVYKDYYHIEGKKYDRVTAILDYFTPKSLLEWRDKVGVVEAKEKQKAGKADGTRVHTLTEQMDNGKYVKFTDYDTVSVKNCIEGYRRWKETEKPTILAMEKVVFNDRLGIAGTFDRELTNTLVDIKSSNQISRTAWLQLAIYNYMMDKPKDKLAVLRLDKMTSEYEYKAIQYDVRLADVYIGLLNYYRFVTYKADKKAKGDSNGDYITNGKITGGLGVFQTEVFDTGGFQDWQERVFGTGR